MKSVLLKMKTTRISLFLLAVTLTSLFAIPPEWKEVSRSDQKPLLLNYLKCKMKAELVNEACRMKLPGTVEQFNTNTGFFITLIHKGKVRGCFGSFYHSSSNLEKIFEDYIAGALKNDPRYPPLELQEAENTRIILTVGDRPFNVQDFRTIPLKDFGILLTKENGQSFVYVPAELKSHRSLKEIIQRENIQEVAAFRAITIK